MEGGCVTGWQGWMGEGVGGETRSPLPHSLPAALGRACPCFTMEAAPTSPPPLPRVRSSLFVFSVLPLHPPAFQTLPASGTAPLRYGHGLVPLAVPTGVVFPPPAPEPEAPAPAPTTWRPAPCSPFRQSARLAAERKVPVKATDYGIHHVGVPLAFDR